jgi:Mg-chelatase subunit ChlD
MVWNGKLARAKAALQAAIAELGPDDSFNIIDFAADIRQLSAEMVGRTPESAQKAAAYLERITVRAETNLAAAIDRALAMKPVTHVYVISDGDPTAGIKKPEELRTHVRRTNAQKAQIVTLALGSGDTARGSVLLEGIAADNNGQYTYINVKR